MANTKLTAAYDRGYTEARAGEATNPYPPALPEFIWWNEGAARARAVTEEKRIYDRGFSETRATEVEATNPYPPDSNEATWWGLGASDARDDEGGR